MQLVRKLFYVSSILLLMNNIGCGLLSDDITDNSDKDVSGLTAAEGVGVFEQKMDAETLSGHGLKLDWISQIPDKNRSMQIRAIEVLDHRLLIETRFGQLLHLDGKSGDWLNTTRLKDVLTAPPTMIDDKIYIHTFRGLAVINAHSGVTEDRLVTRTPINTQPLPYNGTLILGSATGSVTRLDPEDSSPLWTRTVLGSVLEPIVAQNNLIGVTSNRRLLIINADSGNLRADWSPPANFLISSGPAIDNDRVYVGTNQGFLYSFHIPQAEEMMEVDWRFPTGSEIVDIKLIDREKLFISTHAGEALYLQISPEPTCIWSHDDAYRFLGRDENGFYFVSRHNSLLLLDPATGEEKWRLALHSSLLVDSYSNDRLHIFLAAPDGIIVSLSEK